MIKPNEVADKAALKESENYAFRVFLKNNADPDELDEQFKRLHKELFSEYDCCKCRNCCKMFRAVIPSEDIEKDAQQLGMPDEEFINSFLEYDDSEQAYKTKNRPCNFLNNGDCVLGEHKPEECRLYPYTDQPDRLFSLLSLIESAEVCPIVYEMFERLKKEYNFKKRNTNDTIDENYW